MKNIHVIVATGEWGNDQLRYRRHRLSEYLENHPLTKEVIWLCPSPEAPKVDWSSLPNGIKQWRIPDLSSAKVFRFGRFIDLFYKKKLDSLVTYLKSYEGKHTIHLWYTFPGFPLLLELLPWDKVIYDCSDLWSSPISGRRSALSALRRQVISQAEKRIMNKADLIYCTSDYLRDRIIKKTGNTMPVHTFENGVEYPLFADENKGVDGVIPDRFSGKVFGYIGGIKPKLDFKLIREVASVKKDWLFLFVGPDQTNNDPDFRTLLKESNVIWTGSVTPTVVPKYMQLIDLGIMPYKSSMYNHAVFPLKLFEFLAAGKPVVGVHLPSTKKFAQKHVYTHLETHHASEFIHACEQLLKDEDQRSNILVRKQIAKNKSWDIVFDNMTHFF